MAPKENARYAAKICPQVGTLTILSRGVCPGALSSKKCKHYVRAATFVKEGKHRCRSNYVNTKKRCVNCVKISSTGSFPSLNVSSPMSCPGGANNSSL